MSIFTAAELEFPHGTRLLRIATVGPDDTPHVTSTGFTYNPDTMPGQAREARRPSRLCATSWSGHGELSWVARAAPTWSARAMATCRCASDGRARRVEATSMKRPRVMPL